MNNIIRSSVLPSVQNGSKQKRPYTVYVPNMQNLCILTTSPGGPYGAANSFSGYTLGATVYSMRINVDVTQITNYDFAYLAWTLAP